MVTYLFGTQPPVVGEVVRELVWAYLREADRYRSLLLNISRGGSHRALSLNKHTLVAVVLCVSTLTDLRLQARCSVFH